jgi:hypothetical protein
MKSRRLAVGTRACRVEAVRPRRRARAGSRWHGRNFSRPRQRLLAAPFCFRETIGCKYPGRLAVGRWEIGRRRVILGAPPSRRRVGVQALACSQGHANSPLKISFFVGDEVTSLKSLRFLKGKLETPYVVSCFFNSLPNRELQQNTPAGRQRSQACRRGLFYLTAGCGRITFLV